MIDAHACCGAVLERGDYFFPLLPSLVGLFTVVRSTCAATTGEKGMQCNGRKGHFHFGQTPPRPSIIPYPPHVPTHRGRSILSGKRCRSEGFFFHHVQSMDDGVAN